MFGRIGLLAGVLSGCGTGSGETGGAAEAPTVRIKTIETTCERAELGVEFPEVETALFQVEVCNRDSTNLLCMVSSGSAATPDQVSFYRGEGYLYIQCGRGWSGAEDVVIRYLAFD